MKVIFRNAYTQSVINEFDIVKENVVLNMINDFTINEYIFIRSSYGELIKAKFVNYVQSCEDGRDEIFFTLFFVLDKNSKI